MAMTNIRLTDFTITIPRMTPKLSYSISCNYSLHIGAIKNNKKHKNLKQLQIGGVMPISLCQSTCLHAKSSEVYVEAETFLSKLSSA